MPTPSGERPGQLRMQGIQGYSLGFVRFEAGGEVTDYRAALEAGLDDPPGWQKTLDAYEAQVTSAVLRSPDAVRNRALARLLLDLHRCEHGRTKGDPCFGCNGASTGNLLLPPGTVIGHTVHGHRITVPTWENHNEAKAWTQGP